MLAERHYDIINGGRTISAFVIYVSQLKAVIYIVYTFLNLQQFQSLFLVTISEKLHWSVAMC